jgi:hypothetical protein
MDADGTLKRRDSAMATLAIEQARSAQPGYRFDASLFSASDAGAGAAPFVPGSTSDGNHLQIWTVNFFYTPRGSAAEEGAENIFTPSALSDIKKFEAALKAVTFDYGERREGDPYGYEDFCLRDDSDSECAPERTAWRIVQDWASDPANGVGGGEWDQAVVDGALAAASVGMGPGEFWYADPRFGESDPLHASGRRLTSKYARSQFAFSLPVTDAKEGTQQPDTCAPHPDAEACAQQQNPTAQTCSDSAHCKFTAATQARCEAAPQQCSSVSNPTAQTCLNANHCEFIPASGSSAASCIPKTQSCAAVTSPTAQNCTEANHCLFVPPAPDRCEAHPDASKCFTKNKGESGSTAEACREADHCLFVPGVRHYARVLWKELLSQDKMQMGEAYENIVISHDEPHPPRWLARLETARALRRTLSGPLVGATLFVLMFAAFHFQSFVLAFSALSGAVSGLPIALLVQRGVFGTDGGASVPAFCALAPFLALGLGVDNAFVIHDTYRHVRTRAGKHIRPRERLKLALRSAGPAIAATSVAIVAGFLANGLSSVTTVQKFGCFVGVAMFWNSLHALIVFPAALVAWDEWGSRFTGFIVEKFCFCGACASMGCAQRRMARKRAKVAHEQFKGAVKRVVNVQRMDAGGRLSAFDPLAKIWGQAQYSKERARGGDARDRQNVIFHLS